MTQSFKPLFTTGRSKLARFLAGPVSTEPRSVVVPDDLEIHLSGAQYDPATGDLDYLWFDLREQTPDGERRYVKVIRPIMLTYLPQPEREESPLLLEMQKAIKAVCTARIDLVCLSLNVVEPDIGIVQIYGAQAIGDNHESAANSAAEGLAVVIATLRAAYAQSIFKPLPREIGQWLAAAYGRMPFALVMRGQPDPRTHLRAPQSPDLLKPASRASEVGLQQIEYVYRGMVAGQHEFVNVVMVARAGDGPEDIHRLQERLATEMSIWGSRMRYTAGFNVGVALPIALQAALGHGATTGYSAGEGQSVQRSQGAALGQAHSDSVAVSDVWGRATTQGESWSTAQTSGHSQSTTTGVSHSTSIADGTSHTAGQAHTVGDTQGSSSGTSTTHGTSSGTSQVASSSQNWSNGVTAGGGLSAAPLGIGVSGKLDVSHSDGGAVGLADGVSTGVMDSTTQINLTSHAHTEANTTSVADGVGHSVGQGTTTSTAQTVGSFESQTQAHGTSIAQTESYAHGVSRGQGDTRSASVFGSSGSADSIGLARSQALAVSASSGLAVGLVPSIGFSQSYQGIDYNAQLIHDALARQFRLTETMALEGGVFVDSYFLVPTPEARAALKGLIAQAFHGTEEVATPVQVLDLAPDEDAYLRLHALTAIPSTMPEPSPWALEGWRHTTLMTMLQAATCVAPGRFEHGAALTTWEPLPALANVALNFRQGGLAVLGHLISPEVGEVRRAQVRLTEDQLFPHWLVAADTRFGKTVLAQRIVYEMLQHHRCRVIACDFAAGWRDLITVLGSTTQPVEYGSLYPGAARPLHFNCLRVGPNIDAASTLAALVDLTAMAGRFGERQYGFLHQTLRDLYLEHGVLTEDDWVLDDLVVIPEPTETENGKPKGPVYRAPRQGQDRWGWLRTTEKDLINTRRRARGEDDLPNKPVRLLDLHRDPLTARADRHAIAAYRSRRVDVRRWVERLTQLRDSFKRLPTSFDSIQGILNRLYLLAEGELGRMLGAGEDSLTIEELAWPQGLAVIEAGEGEALSAFTKSLLFSIIAWRIYTDAVKRWQQAQARGERVPHTVIVLEEANKIYGSVEAGSANQSDAPHHSDLFPKMHRDAGKYDLTFINNLQSPGEIPLPIVTSSNNVAISKLQGDVDAKVALAALGFSPHGLHDLRLYHLLTGKIAQAQFVVKLGLHTDRTQIAPFLMRPLRLALAPVTDRDILKQFNY